MLDLKSELLKQEPDFETINHLIQNSDEKDLSGVLDFPIWVEKRRLYRLRHAHQKALNDLPSFKNRSIVNLLMEVPSNEHKFAILERLMPFIDFKKIGFYLVKPVTGTTKGYFTCDYQETLPLHFLHHRVDYQFLTEKELISLIEKMPKQGLANILNHCDSKETTILDLALQNKRSSLEFIQFLIEKGAQPTLNSLNCAIWGSLNVEIIKLVYSKINREDKEKNVQIVQAAKKRFPNICFSTLLNQKEFFQYMIDNNYLNVSDIQAIAPLDNMLKNYENRHDPKDDDLSFLFYMAKKKGYKISDLLKVYAKHLTEKYLKELKPFNYQQQMENINIAKKRYELFREYAKQSYDDINQVDSKAFCAEIVKWANQLITLEKQNRDNLKEMEEINLESFDSLKKRLTDQVLKTVKEIMNPKYGSVIDENARPCAEKIVSGLIFSNAYKNVNQRIEAIAQKIQEMDTEIKFMVLEYNVHIRALKMESSASPLQSFEVENTSDTKKQDIDKKIEIRKAYVSSIMEMWNTGQVTYPIETDLYMAQVFYPKQTCIDVLQEFKAASNEATASLSQTSRNKKAALNNLMLNMLEQDDTQQMQGHLIKYLTVAMQKRTGLGYWSRHTTTANALMKVIKKNAKLLSAIWPSIFFGVDAKLSESLIYEKIAKNLKGVHGDNKKIGRHEDVKKIWTDHQQSNSESELTVFSRFKSH